MEISLEYQKYFLELNKKADAAYDIAERAKIKHYDPESIVEIPRAKNMAERVEGLVSAVAPQIIKSGIVDRLVDLEKEYGKGDWRVGFKISLEVAQEKFCKFKDKHEAIEVGLRIGLAFLTNGVLASPLEGFTQLKIKKRRDGKEYLCLFFSGPIRSAGTTATCVFVCIADHLRKKMGYERYDPDENEIKRVVTELYDYHEKVTNLQYLPTEEEIYFMVKNLPLQIDGDPSEKFEVSNYKNLDRIEANRIRNGICLVFGEGLCQKAAKFYGRFSKWMNEVEMDDWKFIEEFVKIQKAIKAKDKKTEDNQKIKADYTFINDIVAGRPVITHPLRIGGLRLRYGRGRNTGLSSTAIHPATMIALNGFIATGSQLRMERPGKGCVVGVCDSIEGPIVKLKNGDVIFLDTEEEAVKHKDQIKEILFLGDILINYGDFFNRAHVLIPPGYCEEWWIKELLAKASIEGIVRKSGLSENLINTLIKYPSYTKISFNEAYSLSKLFDIPLHPRFTYHWKDVEKEDARDLLEFLKKVVVSKEEDKLIIPYNDDKKGKRLLEILGIPHKFVTKEYVVIEGDFAKVLMLNLNFSEKNFDYDILLGKLELSDNVLEFINKLSEIKIKDKSGICIGARMGRPEKAKVRKLTGTPQILFPVGSEGGKFRSFQSTMEFGKITGDFPINYCDKCDGETIYFVCDKCDNMAEKRYYCKECNKIMKEEKCKYHNKNSSYRNQTIDINRYIENAKKKLKIKEIPNLIKGVRGTSNEEHIPEHLVKGILRAFHNLPVNKDGTIRYDMTETVLTHFKPIEIGTHIKKLKELGYEKDIYGNELNDENQILELKIQDVVLPASTESGDEGADIILSRIANFIDDLLEGLYGVERFYNLKKKEDLIGHLIISLAPHISAAVVGRIIGFSRTQGGYAHPLWHSAQRRDCDGDECGFMLLLDGLLNFSRKFLPAHRGATQDSPLVLTTNIIASEVDDMVFDMDTIFEYPLEFYEACEQYKMPWEVKIDQLKNRLGTERQYEGYGFTHHTTNINFGIRCSAYKFLPTMMEKVRGQMELAEKIRAVDENDVARLVIERHFIRDIRGNLRKFSMQEFRCVNCNAKYRRPPLIGRCLKCDGKIIFTISEGSITKYLEPSFELARRYTLPSYLQQGLELTKSRIESLFGREDERQEGLTKWF